jgi:carotenoid cleavage dioxygenase
VVVHGSKVVATFYQCGEAYQLDPETLDQLGVAPWALLDGVSAHAKVDERTGEMLFFNYSEHAPYMHYGVVDAAGRVSTYIPVPLAGPRLPHDMAFSERFSIVNDLPVFWDAELLRKGVHAVRLHEGLPSRFGVIPRHGEAADICWFDAEPCYILHFLDAYEDGNELVMDGYFQENPTPRPAKNAPDGYGHLMAFLDEYSFQPKLHRWRFNLKTGKTREGHLDERVLEFGTFNQRFAGRPYRYATPPSPSRAGSCSPASSSTTWKQDGLGASTCPTAATAARRRSRRASARPMRTMATSSASSPTKTPAVPSAS